MSQDLFSVARLPGDDIMDSQIPDSFRIEEPQVRLQARGIIGAVLASCSDADSEAARRLREHVLRYPDEPERALLEHLMETGRMNRLAVSTYGLLKESSADS